MILLSPDTADGPVGMAFPAPFAVFTFFLTPPTGAGVAAGLPAWCARRLPLRLPRVTERRCVDRISSKDWSSLPDMIADLKRQLMMTSRKLSQEDRVEPIRVTKVRQQMDG